jgi:transcriptional repressor NrdR
MERLRALDQIAYIRFASVYQSFHDLEQLKQEVDSLLGERAGTVPGQTSLELVGPPPKAPTVSLTTRRRR